MQQRQNQIDQTDKASEPETEEALRDPATFERFDEAMGDLGDAEGASSMGGPAA